VRTERRREAARSGVLLAILFVGWSGMQSSACAAGPERVNGAGAPLAWRVHPVPFNPDQGNLGLLDNAQAVAQVAASFAVWEEVATTDLRFENAGPLPVDVTAANYSTFFGVCGDGWNPIVFDTDGAIVDALFGEGASNDVLAVAGADCVDFLSAAVSEASALLNGRWIDGVDAAPDPEVPISDFGAVMIHELGHYLNLDHSQVNLVEAFDADPTNDAAVPTMFPILVSGSEQSSLHLDDRVSVSSLYPTPSFGTSLGTITGRVLRTDGTSPFQGAYVVARSVADPHGDVVGTASGARFRPASPGGPPPADLEGRFEISGLPPGEYIVEVGPINPVFSGGSFVGPLNPPVAFPGTPELWNGAAEDSTNPPDDPTLAVPVVVTPGATHGGVDFVINPLTPAPNDECSAATEVLALPLQDAIDAATATRSASDPLQSCTIGGASQNSHSVWYAFTPPVDATVRADTFGSTYDTVLTAYEGACEALTEVACSDDVGKGLQSEATFPVLAGITYRFAVTALGSLAGGGTLLFNLRLLGGCGNGVREAGETCDDGDDNGRNGCCTAECAVLDGDADGVCDGRDRCPAVADPSQRDGDGDGLGDACDPCLTLTAGQTLWRRPRLVVSGFDDRRAGNERLTFRGEFTTAPGSLPIDPLASGARVDVVTESRQPRLQVELPPGAFVRRGAGWISDRRGRRHTFIDRRGETGGITRFLVTQAGAGTVRVSLRARRAHLQLLASDLPLRATVVLGDSTAAVRGACGEISFARAPERPGCNVRGRGRRIVCR
jgi:hypothetical protein